MGRQLHTCLTSKDSEELISILRDLEIFSIIRSRSESRQAMIVDSVATEEENRASLYCFLVRRVDLESIVMRRIDAQNCWVVDPLRSPVIEFTRSFSDGTSIRVGRFWYERSYFGGDGNVIRKEEAFLSWADRVFKCIRQHLRKSGNYLVGNEAFELIEDGNLRVID